MIFPRLWCSRKIYQVYRAQSDFFGLVRPFAAAVGATLRLPWPLLRRGWPVDTVFVKHGYWKAK
jgi:hypothetical protein